ncbi:alpha/beta hydrolase [Actinophytocola sp.]|uniref:alpha/beta hydrolase n=1 Tax=Actinophytocola sp. TaxID=1872138 RepID=UPI003D6A6AEF
MIDPETLYGQLASGDTGRIRAAAEPVTAAMSALTHARSSLDGGGSTATAGWQGAAADAFAARSSLSGTATSTAHARLDQAAKVLEAAAGAYQTMRAAADNAISAWRSRPAGLDGAATAALADRVNQALTTVRDGYERTLRAYAGSLTGLRPAFAEVAGSDATWQRTASPSGATVPPPGSDPRAVAAWWQGLSRAERDQLLATRFDALGRLRGLPAGVLDDANRRRIDADQERLGASASALDGQITQRASEVGLDPSDEGALRADPRLADLLDQRQDVHRQLDNAVAAEQRVAEAAARTPDEVYVLSYDPVGPGRQEGTLAVAFGNPDVADNVAIAVPGVGTTLENGFPNEHAAELREEMDAAAPGERNATVAWLGYDAPSWDLSVASTDDAKEGGALLVSDVDGYRAAAEAAGHDPHVTALGHSYGSTVVGYGGMNGLAADDLAFLGSPGVGASSVDQLSAGAGHVWAGATEHDPIVAGTSGDWFTEDGSSTTPYEESFGANQFEAATEENLFGAHSTYYQDGSESLRNLGNIATGNYDAVTEPRWQDSPLPPSLPGSDLPVVGPAIDAAANLGKEAVDIAEDVGGGLWNAAGDALHGDWDGAWDELRDTGGELLNDAGDVVVGTIGDVVEGGRDLVEAGKSLYDNTLGRLF